MILTLTSTAPSSEWTQQGQLTSNTPFPSVFFGVAPCEATFVACTGAPSALTVIRTTPTLSYESTRMSQKSARTGTLYHHDIPALTLTKVHLFLHPAQSVVPVGLGSTPVFTTTGVGYAPSTTMTCKRLLRRTIMGDMLDCIITLS